MRYVCNEHTYEAKSLDEAYLFALQEQGLEALGKAVIGENKDFLCSVCLEAYRRAFPTFTDNDFLNHEIAVKSAWCYGNTYTYSSYDEDWEECTITSLDDATIEKYLSKDPLDVHMRSIGFVW